MSSEKPYEERIWLCEGNLKDGTLCPLADRCAFYCTGFDKTKTDHWSFGPYNQFTGKCSYFQEIDLDFKELNITSDAT